MMKKRMIMCCLAFAVMGAGISAAALQGGAWQHTALEESIAALDTIVNNDAIEKNVSEKLKQETVKLSEQGFTSKLGDEIIIDQSSRQHLAYILTAKEFLDQVEVKKTTASQLLSIELRDECNSIFDTMDNLRATIWEDPKLSDGQKSLLSDMYNELIARERTLKEKFPMDYNREFTRNADLTKDYIYTEYMTIPELSQEGPSYIKKIDDIVKKVGEGTLTPQQGNDEVDRIWKEWKKL